MKNVQKLTYVILRKKRVIYILSHHRYPKLLLSKNDINSNNKCLLHNKPYLFYCNIHESLCEDCRHCGLVESNWKFDFSHYYCYFGPVLNLVLKSEIENIKEKIEKSINFFNSHIFNLYNDNKDNYKNTKRKRFERNFKKYRNNFVSFLEFNLLLIKTFQKKICFLCFIFFD